MTPTRFGPGDEQTWGGPTDHPLDPRNDFDEDEPLTEDELERMKEDAQADAYLDALYD